ncbi:2-hydroxyacid dehydrogenase [Candidatus Laterigemmans baculatus]|uniref:2-hydroxyacid dehydrogenase n=1 Tax=Candidatus Laterigemmans baculatus TaxID=2770505 RepID=UPI0013DC2104|nr:D-glycerate dehydrogenase [Candidatus Laterigemmans baculatus]
MAAPRVFVTRQIPCIGLERLSEHCDVEVWPGELPPDRNTLLAKVPGAAGLLTLLSDRIDAEVFAAAGPQLKVVSNYAVGYNNIDTVEAQKRGVRVGNTPDVLTAATADMAVALLLAAARHLREGVDDVREGRWQTWKPLGYLGVELSDRTIGIVGGGRIGAAVAQRLHGGWKMRVLYTARSDKRDLEQATGARRVSFEELLEESDFVSIHCDLNPETAGMFDAAALQRMKPGSVLVNTARGGVVDQDALLEALRNGPLLGAGLDVTDPEPLSPEHPLAQAANCVIAPHIGSATREAREAMARIAADNLLAGLFDQPLPAAVV